MILSADYLDLLERLKRHFVLHADLTFQDQLDKVYEEIGEVAEAWIGVRGKNPRKGITHTREDVANELADVVITSLLAIKLLGFEPNAVLHLQAKKTEQRLNDFDHGFKEARHEPVPRSV